MTLDAPTHWRTIDFISDLHLQAEEKRTFEAFQNYLQNTPADAVFILGDLFEVWVGDDCLDKESGFESYCASVLLQASQRINLFVMHGNRDFLMGPRLMTATGATLIPDPTVLKFAHQRWVLTHGDALCLADTAYMAFRAQVRQSSWQQSFLGKPLAERMIIARGLRDQSEHTKSQNHPYADVDFNAADALLVNASASTLIHGHTHRPNHHHLACDRTRWVLSDWDFDNPLPRADGLRIECSEASPQPYRFKPDLLPPTR